MEITKQQMTKLLDVSPVTVTIWETGKTSPCRASLRNLVGLTRG